MRTRALWFIVLAMVWPLTAHAGGKVDWSEYIDRGAPFACNVRHVVGLHASNVGGVVTMTAASNASPDGAAVKAGMKRGAKIGAVGMAALTALYIGAGTDEGVGFLIVNTLGAAVAGGAMGALVGAAVGVIR